MASTSLLVLFLLAITCCFVSNSLAFELVVGGRDGWVVNPVESYDHWARRLRFQVNDSIIFRYSNATDSVLEVSKEDYENCNVDHPLIKLEGGNSVFKFGHSGPFYFITGNKTNCEKGQKLLIVVLAVRRPPAAPVLPVSPPTSAPSPSTAISPSSPAPTGSSPAPAVSPAAAPAVSPAAAPAVTPAAAPAVTPAAAPAVTPAAAPAVTPAAGPGSSLAPIAPGPLVPSSSEVAPGAENTPADVSPPSGSPARSSATLTFIPTAVSTMAVSIVFIAMTSAWSIIA